MNVGIGYLHVGTTEQRDELAPFQLIELHPIPHCAGPHAEENYVTSPPSETPRDLADFQNRHGEAPRFAGKGRETALGRCRIGAMRRPFSRRRRASSQGWNAGSDP